MDIVMVALALSNFALLASSRLMFCVRAVAFQGILLSSVPLLTHDGSATARLLLLAAGTLAIKGIVFPLVLRRVIREVNVRREVEPYIGYGLSHLLALTCLLWSVWLSARLPLPAAVPSGLIVPVSFFTIMSGLLVIVSRKKAVTQVLGYIVLENGIYAFGAALVTEAPILVEIGVLLDLFVAVFVMGITIFHISQEFDHIDTDQLAALRDWEEERA